MNTKHFQTGGAPLRSPDKHRYLAALRLVETDGVSFQENEFDSAMVAHLLGRSVPRVRSFELPARDLVELALRAGNDMVYLAHIWELGRHNVFDKDGRKHYQDGTMKTRADLKRIVPPPLAAIRRALDETLSAMQGTGLGLIYALNPVPFIVTTAVGYEDYYIALAADPDFILEFQKAVAEYCFQQAELVLSYPVDALQIGLVLCSKQGPMMSRSMMEQFEFPYARKVLAMARAKGCPVTLHTDGYIADLIPTFIEMGFAALNPLEPCDGRQDIYELKRRCGDRIALHGNIDLAGVLVQGAPDEVAADVSDHCARLSVGGGYLCASSHNITEAVPPANFYAMRDAVHAFEAKIKIKNGY
ncbi:MAG: hypothetical protein HYV35_10800 [Lentisphaerae bacterium]|nr:hypothetical protein [Lentisphaerota bacterium]